MNSRCLFGILVFSFPALFFFTSCVKEGPMGLPGENGTNGTNGKDGKDGTAVCLVCHNTATSVAKEAQYKLSKHYFGTTSARNGKYCARCHTNEGFKEITGNGKFVVANDIPMATRISCETCHKHSSFEFKGDTSTFILRTTSPIALEYYKNARTQDFGKINNLCITCHQIRGVTSVNYTDSLGVVKTFDQLPFFPLDNIKEGTTVKYQVGQSFSVHDGNQSNLFAGINGYEYAGKTYTRKWKHSDNACTDCHMNQYDPVANTGGHTLIPNKAKCAACHGASDKIANTQTAISAKLVELGEALVAKKLFRKTTSSSGAVSYSAVQSHDFYGTLFPTSQTTKKYATALASVNTVSPTTGLVIYGNTVTMAVDASYASRIGREWKYGELGAAYNYGFINSELSIGVHNPTYAMQILQNSIDYLKSY
jgi:Cytochrome c554 and c-prime